MFIAKVIPPTPSGIIGLGQNTMLEEEKNKSKEIIQLNYCILYSNPFKAVGLTGKLNTSSLLKASLPYTLAAPPREFLSVLVPLNVSPAGFPIS